MTPLARIAQVSAAFLCSNMARAAIGFALALVLGRGLGADRFGTWILCSAWASTLTVVVDLGFGVLLTRDGARRGADAAALLRGALRVRLAAAVPLAMALAAGARLASSDPQVIAGARMAAILGTAGAAYGCFGALMRSRPRWLPMILAAETGWIALQVPASWWLVRAGYQVSALIALAAALQFAQIVTAAALWRTVFGRGSGREGAAAWRPLLRRALPFAASGLIANLHGRVAPLMLGMLAGPIDVGWFGAASRVGRAVKLAPQAVFAGALPVLADEYGRDEPAAAHASAMLDRALAALSLAAAAACVFGAPLIMRLVFGTEFVGGASTLAWTAVGLVPALTNSARKVALYAGGREAAVVRWSAAALVLQVASAAAIIPLFGSAGAALSMAIAEAAVWPALRSELRREHARLRTAETQLLPSHF